MFVFFFSIASSRAHIEHADRCNVEILESVSISRYYRINRIYRNRKLRYVIVFESSSRLTDLD
jgi:kynureninase